MMTEIQLLDGIDALVKARRETLAGPPAVPANPTPAPQVPPVVPTPTPPAPPPAATVPDRLRALGVFSPMYAGGTKLPAYVTWLGRAPTFVADNADETGDWKTALSSVGWLVKCYKPIPATIVLGVPLLPRANTGQFVAGAKGDFDVTIKAMATSIKALLDRKVGEATHTVVIRPGWEFNGAWMPWFAGKDVANYKAYYRRFVGIFRAVDPRFTFDWCATLGEQGVNTFSCYPGDDVVDKVGADVYDEAWNPAHRTDVKARWAQRFIAGSQGLTAFRDFAKAHGKKLSFAEWGCRNRATWDHPEANGGDNPYFIEQMAAWFDGLGPDLAYHCYFERADVFSALSQGVKGGPTLFPKAAVKFRELFGG